MDGLMGRYPVDYTRGGEEVSRKMAKGARISAIEVREKKNGEGGSPCSSQLPSFAVNNASPQGECSKL